jgi:RND superfamily putative drug exporter
LAGIAVGFAGLHLLGLAMPMSVWSMNFSLMIGLAVGIDYSLFIVSRYREERAEGKDALAAIENTMSTAGKAVFLSALTVVMALAAVFLVPVMVFRSMALGMILSVVAVALASLTLLPALLVALGDRVLVKKNAEDRDITAESRWQRVTGVALRRPGRVLAIGLVVLGVLIAPALGMRLGMPKPRTCKPAKPTAMPASARTSGSPAAMSAPNATNNRIKVGRPLTSSALWSASALMVLKSLQTGHSPVTSARAPERSVSFST